MNDEQPLFFRAPAGDLFGILSIPTNRPLDVGVIIAGGAGLAPASIGRNAVLSRLARELAACGFHSLRFDYRGVGESDGRVKEFHLAAPFVDDLAAAADVLAARGIHRVAVVGVCFGARSALAAARALEELEGVVLMAPPLIDQARGEGPATRIADEWSIGRYALRALHPHVLHGLLTSPRNRRVYRRMTLLKLRSIARRSRNTFSRDAQPKKPPFLVGLDDLASRSTPTLLLYVSGSSSIGDFERVQASGLIPQSSGDSAWLDVRVLHEDIHTFDTLTAQQLVLELVPAWLLGLATPDADDKATLDQVP